jgi:hypothetical protein
VSGKHITGQQVKLYIYNCTADKITLDECKRWSRAILPPGPGNVHVVPEVAGFGSSLWTKLVTKRRLGFSGLSC